MRGGSDNSKYSIEDEGLQTMEAELKKSNMLKSICGASWPELDLSGQGLGPKDAKVVIELLKYNGKLTDLNMSNNNIGELVLPEGWTLHKGRFPRASYWKYTHTNGTEQIGTPPEGSTSGAIAVADIIKNNGTLTSLNLSSNNIQGTEAGKALGDAVAENTVLKQLDLSKNYCAGAEFANEFAGGLRKNNSLVKFDISDNHLREEGTMALANALIDNTVMTELNLSRNKMLSNADSTSGKHIKGVIAIGEAIPTMRLVKFDISENNIRPLGAPYLAKALTNHPVMKELNIAGNNLYYNDMSGGIAISDAIKTMGALTSLNISKNCIGGPTGWQKGSHVGNGQYKWSRDGRTQILFTNPSNALAKAIQNNGKLTSLNVSDNSLGNQGSEEIAKALGENTVMKNLDMSNNDAGENCAQILAGGVITKGTLEKLNIHNNRIKEDTLRKLTELCNERDIVLDSHSE